MVASKNTTMTKGDWEYVKKNWGKLHEIIRLEVDGYDVDVQFFQNKMKIVCFVFVNGEIKGEYGATIDGEYYISSSQEPPASKWNEIGRRFWQTKYKATYSAKEIRRYERIYGKRNTKKSNLYNKIYTKNPSFSSFTAFKRHLIDNNTDIKLIG